MDRLESFLRKRLTRRLSAAASQIGALQKLAILMHNWRWDGFIMVGEV